jgi:chromosome segregation ATPase
MNHALQINHKMAIERYDILDQEHNRCLLEIKTLSVEWENSKAHLGESEKMNQNLKLELQSSEMNLANLSQRMAEKEVEIKDLENDLLEHGAIIETRNKEMKVLQCDVQFGANQIEKLEAKLEEVEKSREKLTRDIIKAQDDNESNLSTIGKNLERAKAEIEKLKSVEKKENKIQTATVQKKQSIEVDSNANVSLETLERIKAFDDIPSRPESDQTTENDVEMDLVVQSKPPSKRSSSKSSSSLKSMKSTRSSSILKSSELNPIKESSSSTTAKTKYKRQLCKRSNQLKLIQMPM